MKRKMTTSEARPPLCHRGADCDDAQVRRRGAARALADERDNFCARSESKRVGSQFEARALAYLRERQLWLVARNVTCRRGEIDLVMRERGSGLLVFVEVRARADGRYGGAAASVSLTKRRRIVEAAKWFLATQGGAASACRFDVIAFDGLRQPVWLRDAFRADE